MASEGRGAVMGDLLYLAPVQGNAQKPSSRPSLEEAFPEGDAWRFAVRPGIRWLLGIVAIATGAVTVLAGLQDNMPAGYSIPLALCGVATVLWAAHCALSEVVLTPDHIEKRGLLGRQRLAWTEVDHAHLIPARLGSYEVSLLLFFLFPVLIWSWVVWAHLLQPYEEIQGNWAVALSYGVLAAGLTLGGRVGLLTLMRWRKVVSEGHVAALRDSRGNLLLSLTTWPEARAYTALEGVLRLRGIPVTRREPGTRLGTRGQIIGTPAAKTTDRQDAPETLPSQPSQEPPS